LEFPLGRLADRLQPSNLIAGGVFLWSLMTALCAAATSFRSLFASRIGVGVGEATLGPSGVRSFLTIFPRDRLAVH
jgi:MFS family permease